MTNIKLQVLCMRSFVMQGLVEYSVTVKCLTFPLTYIYMFRGPAFESVHNIQDNFICIKKDMLFFFF